MSKSEVRLLNGYKLILKPDHPKAMHSDNWEGYVYEHIAVAEEYLGRSLRSNEVVHHLDLNKANNRAGNLLVLEDGQHAKLHRWIASGAAICESSGLNRENSGKPKVTEPVYCVVCGQTLQENQINCCSPEHFAFIRRKVVRPSKDELAKELETTSMLALGKKYGVSDKAVRKWAISYSLIRQS